jgi:hypothetical protein
LAAVSSSSSSGGGWVEAVDAAACLRCLAAAPRLPAADWSSLLHKLLSLQTPAGAAAAAAAVVAQLQSASILLILNHCIAPGLELSGILDACLTPDGIRVLPLQLQTLLLSRLDAALAALPANRAAPVLLQSIVGLVTAATAATTAAGSNGGSDASMLVVLSTWVGLARLAAAAAAGAAPFTGGGTQIIAALHSSIKALLQLLPLLPAAAVTPTLVGEAVGSAAAAEVLQQLLEQHVTQCCWLGAGDADIDHTNSSSKRRGSSSRSDSSSLERVLLVWKAAMSCLKLLHPDAQLRLTEAGPAAAAAADASKLARAVQLRSLLILGGCLDWRDLISLRNTALRLLPAPGSTGGSNGSSVAAEQLLLPLALAAATAGQAGLMQQLQEVAAAARLAAAPVNAAVLTAAMLAAWLAAAASGSSGEAAAAAAVCEQQLVLGSGIGGLMTQLSAVLPQLVSFGGISGSRQAFVGGVVEVVRAVGMAVKERGGQGAGECVQQLHAALYAVHQGGFE